MSGMNLALFEDLARWEHDNFWFVPRNRLITRLLDRHFPSAERLMEVGCGTGFVLSEIANMKPWRHLVASELHTSGLAIARSRLGHRAEFVRNGCALNSSARCIRRHRRIRRPWNTSRTTRPYWHRCIGPLALQAASCSRCRNIRGCGRATTILPCMFAGIAEANWRGRSAPLAFAFCFPDPTRHYCCR